MEWYWVLALILGFFVVVGGLILLGIKGKLGTSGMGMLAQITTALSALTTAISSATANTTDDIIAKVIQYINLAVLAAENSYYNNKITANERYSVCMSYFGKLLTAAGITLTDAQESIVDTLVKAACESMGHTVSISEDETT